MTSRNRLGKKLNGRCCNAPMYPLTSFLASGRYPLNCSSLRSRGSMFPGRLPVASRKPLQQLRYRPALRERSRKPQHGPESWYQIGGFDGAVEHHSLADPSAHRYHPGGARENVASTMMLKAVASGIVVGVAAKVRQNEHSGVAGIFRFALDRIPQVGAEAIGAPDAIDIKRVRSSMRDVDIVHGDPQNAGSHLFHQLARNINR